jgi:hypothetical protein
MDMAAKGLNIDDVDGKTRTQHSKSDFKDFANRVTQEIETESRKNSKSYSETTKKQD